jgi:hypothetical protein
MAEEARWITEKKIKCWRLKYAEFITVFQPSLIDLPIITFILPAAIETFSQFFRPF